MQERSDSTPTSAGTPVVPGAWVSIVVGDDHPLLRLKAARDWAAIQAEMSTHWRAAGKNVEGRAGRPWPVSLSAPLVVLLWFQTYSSRPREAYISESVVAGRFLGTCLSSSRTSGSTRCGRCPGLLRSWNFRTSPSCPSSWSVQGCFCTRGEPPALSPAGRCGSPVPSASNC